MKESKLIMLTILSTIIALSGELLANSRKEDIIAQNVKALSSHDKNKRREAMDSIFRVIRTNRSEVYISQVDREEIRRYMLRWDENSDKAALTLGLLQDRASVSSLLQVMKESRRIQSKNDPMDDRNVLAPRMELACLTALLALNDADAIQEVKQLLKKDTVASISRAIGCIQFAKKAELIPEILPLLNDTRDAVNIAPSGGEYYLRVCDIAINAIYAISKVNVSFNIQYGERYNEQMISEFRTNIRAWLTNQSDKPYSGRRAESKNRNHRTDRQFGMQADLLPSVLPGDRVCLAAGGIGQQSGLYQHNNSFDSTAGRTGNSIFFHNRHSSIFDIQQ